MVEITIHFLFHYSIFGRLSLSVTIPQFSQFCSDLHFGLAKGSFILITIFVNITSVFASFTNMLFFQGCSNGKQQIGKRWKIHNID